jgi:hypothetical protein
MTQISSCLCDLYCLFFGDNFSYFPGDSLQSLSGVVFRYLAGEPFLPKLASLGDASNPLQDLITSASECGLTGLASANNFLRGLLRG